MSDRWGIHVHQRSTFVLAVVTAIVLCANPLSAGAHILAQDSDLVMSPVQIVAVLNEDGSVIMSFSALVNNTGADVVTSVPFRVDTLDVSVVEAFVEGTPVEASLSSLARYTEVSLPLDSPLSHNEIVWVELELIANDLQSESSVSLDGLHTQTEFTFYVRPLTTFRNFTFYSYLPSHATLSQASVVPLFPAPSGNLTDGNSLVFLWYTEQLQVGQERVFIVKYQLPLSAIAESPVGLLSLVSIAAVAFAVGAITIWFGPQVLHRLKRIGTTRFVGVTSEEKVILELIRSKGGSCPQKDLYGDSDMSQAKVSQILSNLEERGLVKRFRDGRENMVHLLEEE